MSPHSMLERFRSLATSPYVALLVFVGVPLLYSGGQEIISSAALHDNYYFLLRSESIDLGGSYFAAIREYTYSLFVALPRAFGLNLRDFEVACYGAGLFALWIQTCKLTKSAFVGWFAVIPLTVLTHQHVVFNIVTTEVLQLILTPLSFASAILVYRRRGSLGSSLLAGLVAGLQVATRPEGLLFLFPPLLALAFAAASKWSDEDLRSELTRLLQQAAIVCLIPFLFLQGLSAINKLEFGFWAPTIVATQEFKGALSALMSIDPSETSPSRFAPVPLAAMEKAYEVSPAFRKAKFFFDENSRGSGWSSYNFRGYEPEDGSISGGHLRWALLHACYVVAGSQPKAMLAYLGDIGRELRAGFASGRLQERHYISDTLGPQFSVIDPNFWKSVAKIGGYLLLQNGPDMPEVTVVSDAPEVESDYDRLALRRASRLQSPEWRVTARLPEQPLGLPHGATLGRGAIRSHVELEIIGSTTGSGPVSGFKLRSPASNSGSLRLSYDRGEIRVPLRRFAAAGSNLAFEHQGILFQLEDVNTPTSRSDGGRFALARGLTVVAHQLMKPVMSLAILWLIATPIFRKQLYVDQSQFAVFLFIAISTLSIIVTRWGLFAAIDSAMFPGWESRYLTATAFALWVLAAFCTACGVQYASKVFRKRQGG